MKTKSLTVRVPDEMDNELATLTACKALLDRLEDGNASRRIVNYLDRMTMNDMQRAEVPLDFRASGATAGAVLEPEPEPVPADIGKKRATS